MSHVATIDLEVKDLDALEQAAKRLGMVFHRGKPDYRWWGRHEGDFPLPAGFSEDDLGKCEHVLAHPNAEYEIGIVRRRDGRPGFTLLWDFIDHNLVKVVGHEARHLKREYATVVATRQAMVSGFRVQELKQPDGSVQLRCVR